MTTSIGKLTDLKTGLSDISYLNEDAKLPALPEKSSLPNQSEAIASHLDAIWDTDRARDLVERICTCHDDAFNPMAAGHFDIGTRSLDWLKNLAAMELDPDKTARLSAAIPVVSELIALDIELKINRNLLIQS